MGGTQGADARADKAEHLRYFGYYLFLHGPDATLDHQRLTDFERIADHANVVKFNAHLPYDAAGFETLIKVMERAQNHELKMILAYPLIFGDLASNDQGLAPARQERWDAYVEAITPYLDDVAAFYTIDEPYWVAWLREAEAQGVPWHELSLEHRRSLVERTRHQLETINDLLNASFPDIPIIMVEAYPVLAQADDVGFKIPSGIDWVGFDCYGPFDDCAGISIPDYFQVLIQRMTSDQRLIAVPPAFVRTSDRATAPTSDQRTALEQTLEAYYAHVRQDPRFIGILAFTWHTFAQDDHELIGLGDLDEATQAAFAKVGRSITATAHSP